LSITVTPDKARVDVGAIIVVPVAVAVAESVETLNSLEKVLP
jgi:hypothetical protein